MPDYPGVDPDGLIPGGLQIAGKVNAGALAILGEQITAPVVDYGAWGSYNGIAVTNDKNIHALALDTEDRALQGVAFTPNDTFVTITQSGTYFVIADAFTADAWGPGWLGADWETDVGTRFTIPMPTTVADVDNGYGVMLGMLITTATTVVSLYARNGADASKSMNGELLILRLK